MKPIRLAHLVSHPIQYFAPLYRELASRSEVDLTVHFYSDGGARPFEDPEFGRRISWDPSILDGYRYRFASGASTRSAGPTSRHVSLDVVRAIATTPYDAVWAHGTAHATTWAALAAARARGARLLVRDEQTLLHRRGAYRGTARKVALRTLFSQSNGLYIGEQNRRHFQRFGMPAERLFPARYCVDNAWFREQAATFAPHRGALREAFGLTNDAPVVLFSGKLIDKKQPLRLIEAFASVLARQQAWLLVVGDGPLRARVEALAATLGILDRVRFAGFLAQREIIRAYVAADLLVLPSNLHETWGLVVNEAMNFSLPVVVSDKVGCALDLVRPGWNGEVTRHDDTAALASAIESLVADPARRMAYGTRSRAHVERYSIEAAADGIVEACTPSARPVRAAQAVAA